MATKFSQDDKQYHQDALARLGEADLQLAHAPRLHLDAPHRMADVTLEWLRQLFVERGVTARLLDIQADEGHEGMTTRQKWKLVWDDPTAGPATVFVKATPPEGYLRETLAMLHMHDLEANFYRILQPENTRLAPQAFHASSYPGGRFLIVLEDLEARGCRPYWQVDSCSFDHARGVVSALARFHGKYWESERLLQDLSWVRPRIRRYGWDWLRQSFNDARSKFLANASNEVLPDELRELLQLWNATAEHIYEYWEAKPRTVLHGDSHLGNTYALPDGGAGLLDWQVMFAGYGLRDVAYFILSALPNEMRQAHEAELVALYLEMLAEQGVCLDAEQARNDYCLMALDAWDASIKTYNHGFYGHAQEALVRNLQSAAGCLIDNDVKGRLQSVLKSMH